MRKTVAVIGGGPAGMQAATVLASLGYKVQLLEEQVEIGGHLHNWDRLFPTKRPATEVLDYLKDSLCDEIDVSYGAQILDVTKDDAGFLVKIEGRDNFIAHSILLATGFKVFDASRKEEYGYGIYDNVITSVELEKLFRDNQPILTTKGKVPASIGIIHCVGSRDEKVGNVHCSRLCCVTGVKQAIELKEALPGARIFCFYMDLRMFGLGYEELYKQSQEEYGIQFIRGRLSESFENQDGSLTLRVEDTLTAMPLRMKVDLLILLTGILPSEGTQKMGKLLGLQFNPNGFLKPVDEHTLIHNTGFPGVFLAGSCKGPMNIGESLADARSAVSCIDSYLKSL